MYQFFVDASQVTGEKITILGSDVNHIKNVLRMKTGEHVRVSVRPQEEFAPARSFFGIVEMIMEDEVVVSVEREDEAGTELSNRICLFQGLPKGDKMELIIQKSVELGVYEVVPVAMKNCVVKLDDKKAVSKVSRWQAIAESAAKQSKRTLVPEIKMPMSWKECIKAVEDFDVVLVPYENQRGMEATREVLRGIEKGQSIAILVGPEGGFAPEEIEGIAPENAVDEKTHRISLGRRILRTETAGLATLSMLVFCLDE